MDKNNLGRDAASTWITTTQNGVPLSEKGTVDPTRVQKRRVAVLKVEFKAANNIIEGQARVTRVGQPLFCDRKRTKSVLPVDFRVTM
jgi:hypothetical protein